MWSFYDIGKLCSKFSSDFSGLAKFNIQGVDVHPDLYKLQVCITTNTFLY